MFLKKSIPNNALDKFELMAKQVLPKAIYDHIAGGAGDEGALHRNRQVYLDTILIPRILDDTSVVDVSAEILGVQCKAPIIIAPTSFHGLVSEEKEIGTALAAKNSDCIMIVSMMANTTLEDIAQTGNSLLWFQLHVHTEHSITEQLIKRAEKSGYKAIVVTVDIPQMGIRYRDIENEFKLPTHCVPANFKNPNSGTIDLAGTNFNPTATWDDVKWLKSVTTLPLLLKGVMHPEDAEKAVEHGVDSIIVSNHGGRQFDSAPSSIEVLPQISAIVKNQIPILIDGGIRSGSDILKAIILGADAVLIGRPILWGLAVGGKQGAQRVLDCLKQELLLAMRLVGCHSLSEVKNNRSSLVLSNRTFLGNLNARDPENIQLETKSIAK